MARKWRLSLRPSGWRRRQRASETVSEKAPALASEKAPLRRARQWAATLSWCLVAGGRCLRSESGRDKEEDARPDDGKPLKCRGLPVA